MHKDLLFQKTFLADTAQVNPAHLPIFLKKDFVFLSNLEEIVYNPSPVYNKSNNSKFEIKCLNDNKMLDKYMELFEP